MNFEPFFFFFAEEGLSCCLVTALLSSKVNFITLAVINYPLKNTIFNIKNGKIYYFLQSAVPNGFSWVHVHQTWLDGYGAEGKQSWLF